MLFNSLEYIFLFLPLAVLGFYVLGRFLPRLQFTWLVAASLFFYGWWNPKYLILILTSMVVNFAFGHLLINHRGKRQRVWLILGVIFNLGLLGYYKYANFLVDNVNALFDFQLHLNTIILPLAISFFTFQQIAFLVDSYRGDVREVKFLRYALFVTFFPQLIAGPIVHHKEMMPQFGARKAGSIAANLGIGFSIFALGFFKKIVIADGMSVFANPVFAAAEANVALTGLEAWGGALAYSMQLYFDFSGYCDMAIGSARLFGIRLPLNFNSPYKAVNIAEFWRRWHMTLSRFLRDYLYIPLGGNRKGSGRTLVNLMLTMLLGGLWHGAGWNFVIWGGLHGSFLVINRLWSGLKVRLFGRKLLGFPGARLIAVATTFFAVTLAWVFFRAESFHGAQNMLGAMTGSSGWLPAVAFESAGTWNRLVEWLTVMEVGEFGNARGYFWILLAMLTAFWLPNTLQFMRHAQPVVDGQLLESSYLVWRAKFIWAFYVAFMFLLSVKVLSFTSVAEFLYFQF